MNLHGYSLTELNNMLPWEREVYITLLHNYLKEKQQKLAQQGF